MLETKINTLDNLPIGMDAIIASVNCEERALRRHILAMGLTPGTEVTLIKSAPMGDPLEIRLRGYELTLRKADASKIAIKDTHNSENTTRKNKEFEDIEHSGKGETPKDIATNKTDRIPITGDLTFALIGNQNSGKTTLFNQLTGSNQHVGNFPGVTVDRTDGAIKGHNDATVTDLPGIYSLSPYSSEEIVTRNFLLKEKPNAIINIIDATNIERNLLLTTELIELNMPIVIALNLMDEVRENGGSIDINRLETMLGVPVVPISASKDEGIEELVEHAINVARYNERPGKFDFCHPSESKGAIHRCIHSIIHLIKDHAQRADIPVRFAATKVVEDDEIMLNVLQLDESEIETCKKIISEMEKDSLKDRESALMDMRFSFIEKVCNDCVYKPVESKEHKLSMKIDKILTGQYTAIPAFLCIMALIFYLTFGSIGSFLSRVMDVCINYITMFTDQGLTAYGLNPIVHSFIINGVFAGVGSVLSFLPIIVVLFFFLSILEDSGYMARVAFVTDKLLRKIGLSGRSFVPMLIGFGCSVPAIMATRTLPSERDRKMTILLTPFMSCSAKLPIYALFTAAFFKANQVLVILSLYLIGIFVGIIFAYFMKFFIFKGEPVPFVMELPNYRIPSFTNVYRLIYYKSKDFVTKAFTIIFVATAAIWFLQTFDLRLNLVTNSANSLLAILGSIITPLFKPLGISNWKISTAFLTGFIAKESVVSTLSVLLDGDINKIPLLFNKLSAFVFLVFCLLYTPCVATIATVKRELGKRYAFLVIALQCSIAWIVAFIVNIIGQFFI